MAYVNSFPEKKETAWQRHHRKKTKIWTPQDSMLPDFLKHDDMESVREKEEIERCGRPCSEMKAIISNVHQEQFDFLVRVQEEEKEAALLIAGKSNIIASAQLTARQVQERP
jgi:hypothetical protein